MIDKHFNWVCLVDGFNLLTAISPDPFFLGVVFLCLMLKSVDLGNHSLNTASWSELSMEEESLPHERIAEIFVEVIMNLRLYFDCCLSSLERCSIKQASSHVTLDFFMLPSRICPVHHSLEYLVPIFQLLNTIPNPSL
jgi:hypothetical protein